MASLSEQLDEMLKEVGGIVNLTIEEREEVTLAGADVLAKNLKQATKDAGHYNADRKIGDMTHLADSIQTGKLKGTVTDGSSAVGFTKPDADHSRIARFLNDGTRYIKGDSFIDNARDKSQNEVLKAQSKVLKKIQEKKRGSS
ncbi:HK97-gp10 family putative phage morphogenesis protein [Leuconostoc mesenteroides]|uniref:HK97-gp10 family putative phage morphogenesis protein n=1 Tax=Leuconostoc mesenteroides TaxID=1245 RepID=UPI0032DEC93D